jgi:protein tyrosine phosphatase (PTP) superfamily phosphohydrolase (DUF442 family)
VPAHHGPEARTAESGQFLSGPGCSPSPNTNLAFRAPVDWCRSSLVGILILVRFAGVCQGSETNTSASRPANWAIKLEQPGLSGLHQVTTNLYRGAQPTTRGMAELKAMGIKTIINLRNWHSDDDEVLGLGLKQGRLHMEPWRTKDEDVVRFLKLATNTNNLPVFVHCQRGADRTGMVCAMYRVVVCAWTKQEAIREMKEGGFGFNPAWKNIVAYIERADIAKIKHQVGIAFPDGGSR